MKQDIIMWWSLYERVNPQIMHDKNDRYTPVILDVYLPTFISASRPSKRYRKKGRQYPVSKTLRWTSLLLLACMVVAKLLNKLKWAKIETSQWIISSTDWELIINLDIFPVNTSRTTTMND